jgi:GTP-binding protein
VPTRASQTALPVVAVVGRPNVGKSTLFNRFVGRRQAIVEDRARTTRDRMYGDAEWNGRRFVLVDTGGLEVDPADPIELKVQEQARLAIREADVILFLVDAVSGLTPADLEAAELLRKATKPILVAVNKVDNTQREADAAEFWSMGWEETYSISASHGRGTGDLLDAIVWALPPESEGEIARKAREDEADEWARDVAAGRLEPYVVGVDSDTDDEAAEALDALDGVGAGGGEVEARWDAAIEAEADDSPAAVAFVGRPNVGKSSLLNALLGEDRAIVSEVPGTTRDAIDTPLAWGRSEVILIDTAGIRRRGKVASGPAAERFSTLRALKAIGRADVAVLVIDAVEGLTAQDAHVAGYIVEEGKGLVIAVNKWDLVEEKTGRTFDQYVEWIQNDVPFLDFAPVVSISAKTGQRVGRVLEMAIDIWGERRKRVSTAELNRVIRIAVERQVPPVVKNRRPKIFYGTQAAVAPPTFVFFANDAASVHFSYRRYLENQLRESFGYHGTPIRLIFRDRESVRLPRRRAARGATGRATTVPGARRPASSGLPAVKGAGGKGSGAKRPAKPGRRAGGGQRPKK